MACGTKNVNSSVWTTVLLPPALVSPLEIVEMNDALLSDRNRLSGAKGMWS